MKTSWIIGSAGLLVSVIALGTGINLGSNAPETSEAIAQKSEQPANEAFDGAIRDYLMRNPEVIAEAQTALADRQAQEAAMAQQDAILAMSEEIFNDPATPLIGNIDGDVTVVEFFDYNCGFCKRAHEDLKTILDSDPEVKFAMKEFPILGPESFAAHRVAVAFERLHPEKYAEFHDALITSPSRADETAAMAIAQALGAEEAALRVAMADPETEKSISKVYNIAQALGINGTPAYVIGGEVISGALGADVILERVKAVRAQAKSG